MTRVVSRIPLIGVFGSGRTSHENSDLAYQIGAVVARSKMDLLTGGGQGVMADACRGFTEHASPEQRSIGILPCGGEWTESKSGYPNPWVQIPIRTHLRGKNPRSSTSRNPINVLSASKALILYGQDGTLAEAGLCVKLQRPVVVVLDALRQDVEREFTQKIQALRLEIVLVRRDSTSGLFDLTAVSDELVR